MRMLKNVVIMSPTSMFPLRTSVVPYQNDKPYMQNIEKYMRPMLQPPTTPFLIPTFFALPKLLVYLLTHKTIDWHSVRSCVSSRQYQKSTLATSKTGTPERGCMTGALLPYPLMGGQRRHRCPYITASWVISGTPESGEITGVFPPALSKEGNGGGGAFS